MTDGTGICVICNEALCPACGKCLSCQSHDPTCEKIVGTEWR